MDSNTHSTGPDGLAVLAAAVDELAGRVLELRRLVDRLEGHWLKELAAVDARGAAGADQGLQAGSTAGWLRRRLRLGATAATGFIRTARALYRGPLTRTGQALADGSSPQPTPSVLAHGTHDLPVHTAAAAEPVLVAAACRLDPPRLRRVLGHLRWVADPKGAQGRGERQHQQRGLWLSPTIEGMVALEGLLEPEAGQLLVADPRSASQRRADALAELARRTLEGGRLPQTGGVRPQLTVTVDLDSLLGRPGAVGEGGGAGPLGAEACPRLACDGAVTRVLVTRHPTGPHHGPGGDDRLAARLRAAATLLPPALGGGPDPAAGGGPDQPGGDRRPTGRPGGPRRRLCDGRLRPAPGLV